ncbi:MAG: hypothetical protein Q7R70_06245 [Candidatus Diapherotrites archaeon]|nr:hypothetical protein [Candidatus Diapherotrites archaeon]
MLRLLKIPENEAKRVKWSARYRRLLFIHRNEKFGDLRLFLKQTQLVLEATAAVQIQSSRKPSL